MGRDKPSIRYSEILFRKGGSFSCLPLIELKVSASFKETSGKTQFQISIK